MRGVLVRLHGDGKLPASQRPARNREAGRSHKGETKTVEVSPKEYRRYTQAVRGDGGTTDEVIQELESRIED